MHSSQVPAGKRFRHLLDHRHLGPKMAVHEVLSELSSTMIYLWKPRHHTLHLLQHPGEGRNDGQLSSNRSISRPRHLNTSTPSIHSASSSPVSLKVASNHLSEITTSLLCHRIWVFLSHRTVLWCLMSRPDGMCIPHKSQRGSGSATYWTTATLDRKWRYMKCSQSCPAL